MSEAIRVARGTSSLGDLAVAVSERGVVAFEFGDRTMIGNTLALRLPGARIVDDQSALAEIVGTLERLVEQPDVDPDITLDPRGTTDELRVWSMLRKIPLGATTTYGALAAELGTRDARPVTEAIAANPIAILIPCHRVIKTDGSLSGYRWGVRRKRALLQREQAAVAFRLT
jgi:AraC family transcriptional regulator, regulatory protein of adaptative response / methylated-DNA-[protein]-cysteine methyltransferase